MALQHALWTISRENIGKALVSPAPSIRESFIEKAIEAERRYLDEGIRRALGLWASELEPELMFNAGKTRPFGITAKGHSTPYILIKWDDNFYLTGESRRFPVSYAAPR